MDRHNDEILLDVYNTVADGRRWPKVLDRIADELGAIGCIVFDTEGEGTERRLVAPYFSQGYEPELVAHYLDSFHDEELAVHEALIRQLTHDDRIEIFGEDFRESGALANRSGASVQWLTGLGIRRWAACYLDKDNPYRSRFSIQMGADADSPDEQHLARLDALLPHVAKALELGRPAAQLARRHRDLVAAMDRLNVGVCILDRQGCIVIANEEFNRQTESYGAFRKDTSGRLLLRDAEHQRRFADLISQIDQHGHFGARPRLEAIVTSRDEEISALCVEIAPLESHDAIGTSSIDGAIVYSLDTARPVQVNVPAFAAAFGLTPAEAELAALISEGLTNAQIADQRDRSVETINAQVKSILGKTRATNRTQLVRLISGFGSRFLIDD